MVFKKLARLLKIVSWNGGIKKSIKTLFLTDTLKMGTLVGTDAFGNKYYQNNYYFYGTNRWVAYNPKCYLNYDASMIPAEWFGWLHHRTDILPCQDLRRPNYKWMMTHEANLTGTPCQYVPYDTTRPKIEAWKPPKVNTSSPDVCRGKPKWIIPV